MKQQIKTLLERSKRLTARTVYNRVRRIDKRLVVLALVVICGVTFFIVKGPGSAQAAHVNAPKVVDNADAQLLGPKLLRNGAFTYNFTFYKDAKVVKLSDGSTAQAYKNAMVMGIKPSAAPMFTDCSEIGAGWKQAFTIQIYGTERPVCTPNNIGFILYFPAEGGKHLVTITFQKAQTTKAYPGLKALYDSIKVST